ncbi:carboxypeptidase-like regulatory domain-containing protein [Polaribacter sp. IC066]|uniref:carboxypeptidase-like regulatory domain-containing protein n=1 Tax=Polaribacter sp. IC066 TaxID=57032 RepID=UPI00168183A1|nr:carboxypeptidase-like regulatory domain-containing protein [Polaribacter sp. IC066]
MSSLIFAQQETIIVSGVVKDSLQQPLNNVTIIAKPSQVKLKIKYAITDNAGFYKLLLVKGASYAFNISHLGHNSINKEVLFSANTLDYNFNLNTRNESLEEVVINYKYKPLEKKKDTITYNLGAFTNGNEFKMQDVLAKLPGIKVEDNVIKVQGKTVTKLLVEGKLFFDGSTKLAIENIPADVMAKIEIISDYKESELLRNLADNEDLALNVVLKEDKKDFAFGDVEAGVGLNEFYSVHNALFKYNPKSNISVIGDINNFNNSSLSFSDLSRLVGGTSNLFKRGDLSNNLMSFASNNQERFKSTTRFSAINFQNDINDKFAITGYAIYANNDIVNKASSIIEYLGNEPIIETREDFRDANDNAAMFNLKFDYNPNANQKWIYNINYLNNNSDFLNESLSSAVNTNQFITSVAGKNDNFSHNLEGYFKLNDTHTMGLALHHSITNMNSTNNWSSNALFLEEYLPITQTTEYNIKQINKINSQKLNFLLKDYWLTSRHFHLFYNIGFNHKKSTIRTDISQVFTDNSTTDFSELSNNNLLTLSDVNAGFGIKSQLGKLEIVLEAKPHYFTFIRAQIESTNLFIEPKLDINYKIDADIDLDFGYDFTNRYLNDVSYLENLKVVGFNAVLQGNPNLTDTRSHNFSLYYSDYKNIDDYFIDASVDYSINNPVENNTIIQSGINRLNMPVILNLPEDNLSLNTELGLMFYKSSLEFGVDLEWLKLNQIINEETSVINSFEYGLSSKWLYKLNKKTQLNLKYKHTGFQVTSDEESRSIENIISLNFDSKFLKNFIFKTDFSTHFVKNFSENTDNYTLQNLYVGYSKPNNKFSYSLNVRNMYNNGVVVRNSFSNNLLMSNQVFTLPRVFLVAFKYKF